MDNNNSNSSSITSLVCGIISLFILPFIFGIISIIFGVVGLSRQEEKKVYSIIGIILGVIGILWSFYSAGKL